MRMRLLFFVSVLLFLGAFIHVRTAKTIISSLQMPDISQRLVKLYIPTLNIALPVQTAKLLNQEWVMSTDRVAFYGEKSALPGQTGTTVVFAHAQNGLFALLPLLKNDDSIILETPNAYYVYKVSDQKLVKPDNVSVLEDGIPNTLAIFTCYGANDINRIVFFAPMSGKAMKSRLNSWNNDVLYHI